MATKQPYKTTFEAGEVIRPIYTGGPVSLTDDGRVLATALDSDVVLTQERLATSRETHETLSTCISPARATRTHHWQAYLSSQYTLHRVALLSVISGAG